MLFLPLGETQVQENNPDDEIVMSSGMPQLRLGNSSRKACATSLNDPDVVFCCIMGHVGASIFGASY